MILNAVLFGHGSHEAAWRHPAARATATLDDWIAHGAADGYNVMPPLLPDGIAAFGRHVVPHLRVR